jgi:hypothetical protein
LTARRAAAWIASEEYLARLMSWNERGTIARAFSFPDLVPQPPSPAAQLARRRLNRRLGTRFVSRRAQPVKDTVRVPFSLRVAKAWDADGALWGGLPTQPLVITAFGARKLSGSLQPGVMTAAVIGAMRDRSGPP